jgi:hypothetical protein
MRTWIVFALGLVAIGCSGSSASVSSGGIGADGGLAPDDAAPSSDGAVTVDGGGGPALYGACTLGVPLGLGAYTEPKSGVTLHWPAEWTAQTQTQPDMFQVQTPYSYVPTGAAAPTNSLANLEIYGPIVASDATDAQKRLDDAVSGVCAGGQVARVTISGHPGVFCWTQAPPPQPGCMNCPGDPGPDIVTIALTVASGLNILELSGRARVNATPAQIFCDMQAMELGLTFR